MNFPFFTIFQRTLLKIIITQPVKGIRKKEENAMYANDANKKKNLIKSSTLN